MIALVKRWMPIIALIILNLAVLIHYGAEPNHLVRFLMAILFFTLLPGLLLLDCLHIYDDDGYKLVLAVIAGIGLDIILYIVAAILGWWWLFNLGAGMVLLALIIKKRLLPNIRLLANLPDRLGWRDWLALSLLSSLLLGLLAVFQFIPNPLPGGTSSLIYYIDQPWHLGNIAEIKNHWPPQDPRLAGYSFNYHIFVYIFIAFLAHVTGITLPALYFRLSIWLLVTLLFAAVYFTGCRWFDRRAAGWLHIAVFFSMGTLLLSYPFNIFLISLFTSPTYLLAAIFTLALLVELRTYMQGRSPARLVLIILLVTGLTGAKGNFFPVLYCGLLAYGIYNLVGFRKDSRINILLATTAVPFVLVFAYIFKGGGSEGLNIVPLEVVRYTHLFNSLSSWLGQGDASWLIWAVLPIYLAALLSVRLPALLNLGRNLAATRHRLSFEQVFMTATIAVSLIAGLTLSYRGRSEYFFIFIGLICLNLLAAGYLLEVYKSHRSRWLQLFMTMLIVIAVADTGLSARHLPQLIPEMTAVSYQPLTPSLHQALLFLRDNSEPDALVASYRAFIYSPDDPRFFYYSAFAERRMLAEGWGYMSIQRQWAAQARYADMATLYTTRDEELAGSILIKYDIDYVIVENQINQHLWFNSGRYLQPVFENGDLEIYRTIN